MTDTALRRPGQQATAADVKFLLAEGRTVQHVADAVEWPRSSVLALINGVPGWLLDQKTDTVHEPNAKGMVPRVPDGITLSGAAATAAAAKPVRNPAPPAPPAPAPAAVPVPVPVPVKLMDAIATILGLLDGVDVDDPTVRRDAGRAREALARLRGSLASADERGQAEADLAAALQAVTDARARIKNLRSTKKPTTATTATATTAVAAEPSQAVTPPKVRNDRAEATLVRVWADERGMACPARGRIPQAVRDQYAAAHAPDAPR